MNFSEYGNKLAREEKGVFTEVGYLYNKYEQEPEYTGVVPDEYKIVGKAIQDLHPKTQARERLDEKLSVIEQIRVSRQVQREPKERTVQKNKKSKGEAEL